jgi:hypothetical protein
VTASAGTAGARNRAIEAEPGDGERRNGGSKEPGNRG